MESSAPPRDTAWAMSEENVEIVRRMLDAVIRRDPDAFVAYMTPSVEWDDREGWPGIQRSIEAGPVCASGGTNSSMSGRSRMPRSRRSLRRAVGASSSGCLAPSAARRAAPSLMPAPGTCSGSLTARSPRGSSSGKSPGPRSRRVVGVGDVAGERRGRTQGFRRIQRIHARRRGRESPCCTRRSRVRIRLACRAGLA